MIHLEHPQAFLFLLVPICFYILRRAGVFTKFSFPLTISDWKGKTFVYKDSLLKLGTFLSVFLALLGFAALIVALSNPIVRQQEKIFTSKGTDILFVVDTSPSMAARDISLVTGQMTRLEAAKLGIKTLTSSEKGTNYGLVAMASESACIVPPTGDFDLFLKGLDSLSVGEFGDGTALGIGLSTAIYHLSASPAPKKCIVLITDGENNAGALHPETAAQLAHENSITLYTFGIGTKGSAPIEYIDKKSGRIHSGFYESDFDPSSLEIIAEIGGGSYFGIESTSSLSQALSEISQKEKTARTFFYRNADTNCYAFFLIVSGIAFALAWIIRRIFLSEAL